MELNDQIKNTAHDIAENYLLTQSNMNDALLELYQGGEIENLAILKRICELANQNVYLSLYQDEDTDKSNLKFDIVDFDKLKTEVKKGENAMDKYRTPPKDFRSLLTIVVGAEPEKVPALSNDGEKLAELQNVSRYGNAIAAFVSDIESLRCHELQNVEKAFEKMSHDTKLMVSNGESLGDIAKMAGRYVKDVGFDYMKVAAAYEVINNTLKDSGFNVKTEFTKISSFKINNNADMFKPVSSFITSIEKVAALNDMLENLGNTLSAFKKVITEAVNPKA